MTIVIILSGLCCYCCYYYGEFYAQILSNLKILQMLVAIVS